MVKRTLMAALVVAVAMAWGCGSSSDNNQGGKDAAVQEDNGNGQADVKSDTNVKKDEGPGSTTDVTEGTSSTDEGKTTDEGNGGHEVLPPPEPCDEANLPTSWGGASIIYSLKLVDPKDSTAMQSCADFDGDGNPDNGFGSFASMANGYLKDDGSLTNQAGVMFEFVDVTDYQNTPEFQMNGLFGKLKALDTNDKATASETECNDMYVDPKSYAKQDGGCAPLLSFKKAKITNGEFDSGVSTFGFAIPIQGLILNLTVTKAHITGTVVHEGNDTCFGLKDGVITGYLLKTDIDAALAVAQDYCDNAENPPDACSYLNLIPTLLTYDLDMDGDGDPDAVSLCVTFKSVKANIVGYVPAKQ